MISRGCPFNCSYCSNYAINKVTKQTLVKIYSPEKAVTVIKENLKLADFLSICFDDDILGIKRNWSRSFFSLYKEKINVPFKCHVRPEYVDEEFASLLKEAGCYRVVFGLETGVEFIRVDVLSKNIKNADFVRCFNLFKKHKIDVITNNMIGVPSETLTDSLQTIKFNARHGVDITYRVTYTPFRFTKLYEYCKENDLFRSPNNTEGNPYDKSVLKLKNYSVVQLNFIIASWNLLFIIYRKLYKFNSDVCIKVVDFLIISSEPFYTLLIFLRNRFFAGKLLTYLYRNLEEKKAWIKK